MSNLSSIPTFTPSSYSLTDDGVQGSNDYIDALMFEHINRGGAPVYVFKLLGLKQRETGITQAPTYIASKQIPRYELINASNNSGSYYKSFEKDIDIISNCYVGVDYGYIQLQNKRKFYSNDASYLVEIRSFTINQTGVTKVRVERSEDGINWVGVQALNITNGTYYIKQSVPSRYWRLKPIAILSSTTSVQWIINSLQFSTKTETHIGNLNYDFGTLENRMRSYDTNPIMLKAVYDPQEILTEFTGFGLYNQNKQDIVIHFMSTVGKLSRPLVIGDVIEFPFEGQYDTEMKLVKKFMEVTDVAWSTQGYTPGYKPLLQKITLEPFIASEENKDITKKLKETVDKSELFPNPTVMQYLKIQPTSEISESINAQAVRDVPQHGINNQNIDDKYVNETFYQQDDAMPQNFALYDEGLALPSAADAKDGQYFRLIYDPKLELPARLYKYSCIKKRWMFMEEDLRTAYDNIRPEIHHNIINGKSPRQ